ncbi:MAG: aromatic acid decarboxylase, partial [Candidatus Bathyarchaeota archaeon]|nr:aromatic acid decarboxylase [Candidatus Bathyarchaeota archaeon]
MKLVVAITGASGVIYSFQLLKILKSKDIETFLIISKPAEKIISH